MLSLSRTGLVCYAACVAVAVVVGACDREIPEPACPGACVLESASDKRRTCLVTRRCADSSQCPSGTRCLPANVGLSDCATSPALPDAPCFSAATGSNTECQVASQTGAYAATLLAGFGAQASFAAALDDGTGPVALSFEPPPEARVVTCALFGCVPELLLTSQDGVERIAIVNYEQCVLADQVFERGETTFALADVDRPAEQEQCLGERVDLEGTGKKQVTTLLVGCWAYGDTDIIGATELLVVPQERIPLALATIVDEGKCGESQLRPDGTVEPLPPDYYACVRPDGTFGTCWDRACRLRCTRNSPDCQSEPGTECCYRAGELLGVCVPPDETDICDPGT